MKNFRLITTLLLVSVSNFMLAQTQFRDLDFNTALKTAGDENKLVMIDCFTDWCSWCKVMDQKTFPDATVARFANFHFVPIKIDMEKGFGIDLAVKYHVSGYPTYLFFSPNGELIYKEVGYQEPTAFVQSLIKATDPASQLHLKGFSNIVELPYPDFFVKATKEKNLPEKEEVVAYLDKQTDLFSEVNWAVLRRYSSMSDKYSQFVLDNRTKYRELFGKDDVDDMLAKKFYPDFNVAVQTKDESALNKYLDELSKYELSDATTTLNTKLYFYQSTADCKNLMASMEELIKSTGKDDDRQLNEYCWTIYEKCDDPLIVHRATEIMSKVSATANSYAEMDTYAALLFKDNQFARAQDVAVNAINLGKAENQDTKSTEELLEKIKGEMK